MIAVEVKGNRLASTQTLTSPSVYLDHFALRKISSSPALAKRFRNAVLERNGTLVISEKTINEFVDVTDTHQALAAERLIVEFWPHVFLMDPNIVRVMECEEKREATSRDSACCNSEHMLRAMNARINMHGGRLELTHGDLLQAAEVLKDAERAHRAASVEVAKAFMADFGNARKSEKYKDRKRAALSSIQTNLGVEVRSTEIVTMYILEIFHRARPKPTPNDYGDLVHACVPSSYCDFVVLDKGWRHIVEQAGDRIKREKLPVKIARALSQIPHNFDSALEVLESCAASPPLKTVSLKDILPPKPAY